MDLHLHRVHFLVIDIVMNTLLGRVTRHPAGMHCPARDDAFVSSLFVGHAPSPERRAFEGCIVRTSIALLFIGGFGRGFQPFSTSDCCFSGAI